MPDMSADMDDNRDTMNCCALECAFACSSAATLLGGIGGQDIHPALEIASIVNVLPFDSMDPRVADPPPRRHSA